MMKKSNDQIREIILNAISDLVSDFTFYDRKSDEFLSLERLNKAVKTGVISTDEIVEAFKTNLQNVFKP